MSDDKTLDKLTKEIDEKEVKQRAYTAVEAAASWLARERREADDSNTDPYSDAYTTKYAPGEDDSGYMSSAEGMTALFMTLSQSENNSEIYLSPRIGDDILTEDAEWLLTNNDEQGIEDGVYRATPYLPRDATQDFTDAVSFTTTTLQEALAISAVDVSDERIKEALIGNKEWFLNNYIDSPTDSGGVGWAWCGSEAMEQMDKRFPPQRYFTFSAAIALADLYMDDKINTEDEKISQLLSKTLKHLISDYWTEIGSNAGWTEFHRDPYGNGLEPTTYNRNLGEAMPSLFSTSNTLFASSYLYQSLPDEVWDNAGITDDEAARIETAIDYLIQTVASQISDGNLEETSTVYRTGATEESGGDSISRDYTDGSLPYTVLNTLIAISRAGDPFNYQQKQVEHVKLATAHYILENCWTGDTGFKHFEEARNEEPVVVYTTELAIESLLWFGLEPPDDDVKSQVIQELEQAQEEIGQLLEQHSGSTQSAEPAQQNATNHELLEKSQKFTEQLVEVGFKNQHGKQFQKVVWPSIEQKLSPDVKNNAKRLTDNGLEEDVENINITQFVSLLNECYYSPSEEQYHDEVTYFEEENEILLLKPQRDAVTRLREFTEDANTTFDGRHDVILDIIEEFTEDPLMGHDDSEVATDFRDRLENF